MKSDTPLIGTLIKDHPSESHPDSPSEQAQGLESVYFNEEQGLLISASD